MTGFFQDSTDIKILLLFILNRMPEPTDTDTLLELAQCDGGITYFDVADCLASLVRTGHVSLDAGQYAILDKGRRDGGITENSLPRSVRVRVERAVLGCVLRLRRDKMIATSRTIRRRGGYSVELTLSEAGDELMQLRLYAVNQARAEEM
ncbi:MAG: DUF4364 family protein, partial [Oscillospiraceae bacterium]|nr:DUF4364 family protein [Oscillospiraceae bacterium]